MQKKNVLTMALSVSLVGVIAVGGTLAYLTANTEELTNTFSFTTNGIGLTLSETATEGIGYDINKTSASEGDGIEYTNIVPGATLDKEPSLTVAQNSVDCYVYALVTGIDTDTTDDFYTTWGTNWNAVSGFQGEGTLLKYQVKVTTTNTASASYTIPNPIFTSVTVNSDIESTVDFDDVVIQGYAIQADAADADEQAIDYFTPDVD